MYDFRRQFAVSQGDLPARQRQFLYTCVLKTTLLNRHVIYVVKDVITVC